MIQVTFTPKITLFHKRNSKVALDQINIDINERCCTFDGPEYYSN